MADTTTNVELDLDENGPEMDYPFDEDILALLPNFFKMLEAFSNIPLPTDKESVPQTASELEEELQVLCDCTEQNIEAGAGKFQPAIIGYSAVPISTDEATAELLQVNLITAMAKWENGQVGAVHPLINMVFSFADGCKHVVFTLAKDNPSVDEKPMFLLQMGTDPNGDEECLLYSNALAVAEQSMNGALLLEAMLKAQICFFFQEEQGFQYFLHKWAEDIQSVAGTAEGTTKTVRSGAEGYDLSTMATQGQA